MTIYEIEKVLEQHKLWLDRNGGERANLSHADLSHADLSCADLDGANLRDADLGGANLQDADLSYADLQDADLSHANLSGADLSHADLSHSTGLKPASEYIEENFEKTPSGYIVYKSFGEHYNPPEDWDIKANAIITENVMFDRCIGCGCGINVGTRKWVEDNCKKDIWKCLIKFEWLADVCVPYHTNGNIRCGKLQLLNRVTPADNSPLP